MSYCCEIRSTGYWKGHPCGSRAVYTYNNRQYCANHFPVTEVLDQLAAAQAELTEAKDDIGYWIKRFDKESAKANEQEELLQAENERLRKRAEKAESELESYLKEDSFDVAAIRTDQTKKIAEEIAAYHSCKRCANHIRRKFIEGN